MTFELDLYLQGHSTLFWIGIQHDSTVWEIMRRRGVSSECRHSSCSSFTRCNDCASKRMDSLKKTRDPFWKWFMSSRLKFWKHSFCFSLVSSDPIKHNYTHIMIAQLQIMTGLTNTFNVIARHMLTYWRRDEMDAITQTTFSSAFFWKKMFQFRPKFHWSLFLRVQLTIFQHWFR